MATNSKRNSEQLLNQERQRSTARQWKSRSLGDDVEVPSGNIALLRRIGPEAFLASGHIPDALQGIVDEAIRNGQGLPPEKMKELSNDTSQIAQMLEMMDRIVVMSCLEPQVAPVPGCVSHKTGEECGESPLAAIHGDKKAAGWHVYIGPDRDEDTLYVDEVDFEDKNFIMQYAMGGTKDLERFRREQGESVESVSVS